MEKARGKSWREGRRMEETSKGSRERVLVRSKEQEIRRKLRKFTRLENKMERTKWTKY